MAPSTVTFDFLGNSPELAHQLATWSWTEWRSIYDQRGQTFDDALRNYQERTNRDRLPLALVALAENQLIGTVSLKHQDLDTRREITPCLGGLFVLPSWRGRGVGSLLIRRAVKEAARLNLSRLFLWTSSAEGLYLKLGWHAIERTEYCGKMIIIMQMDIPRWQRDGSNTKQ